MFRRKFDSSTNRFVCLTTPLTKINTSKSKTQLENKAANESNKMVSDDFTPIDIADPNVDESLLWPEEGDFLAMPELTSSGAKPRNQGKILSILNTVEDILESNSVPSMDPTPIGPSGVQQVVEQVDITENPWHGDQNIVGHLRSLLASRKRRIRMEDPCSPTSKKIRTLSFPIPTSSGSQASMEQHPIMNDLPTMQDPSGKNSGEVSTSTHRFRSYQSQQWYERFQDLLKFRQSHGHCLVPHKWSTNVALAQWVKRQRYQYKLKKAGMHTTMTDEREDALERLGFVWDSHAAVWEERWNEIRLYSQVHGDCNVPSTYPENPPLSIWVKCQRRQYKLFLNGKRSNITQERIAKLNMLGFEWNPRNLKLSVDH